MYNGRLRDRPRRLLASPLAPHPRYRGSRYSRGKCGGILACLGIRKLNPKLKNAERLEHVRSPEGEAIPPNTLAELRRDMQRKRLVAEQIRQIERARLEQLKQATNLMVLILMRVIGIGIETADMLVKEILSRNMRDRRRGPLRGPHGLARRER